MPLRKPLEGYQLTLKALRPFFSLFLKFGHAILGRVLMLNFVSSCINTPLHTEHENVICAKKSFIEEKKSYK